MSARIEQDTVSRNGIGSMLIAGIVIAAAGWNGASGERAAAGPSRVPVVVELFTSEGCSSCPPADDLLTRLAATQPVAGAEILALGEHVDYWDHLGWRDSFSSPAFSERQSVYEQKVFHEGSVYTPQMVVDGRKGFLGSDSGAALAALKEAVRRPQTRLSVTLDAQSAAPERAISVNVRVIVPPEARLAEDAEIFLALTQDGLESQVRRGENRGRLLRHSAVVRSLRSLGTLRVREEFWTGTAHLLLPGEAEPGPIRIVVFVQEEESRGIVGAASAILMGTPK
jgi:hypothetical protein